MKELYKIHAELCKVFSNSTRLEILNLLRDKEMSVTELIEKTKAHIVAKSRLEAIKGWLRTGRITSNP